jgi:hypothetical protein
VRAVRVCVGLWGGWTTVERKKKRGKAVCRKTGQEKLILCQL